MAAYWTRNQLTLINLIKENPILYTPEKFKRNKKMRLIENATWGNVAKNIGSERWRCKKRWRKMKMEYGKLMVLLETGMVSKESIQGYAVIKKYLDGTLRFLDPHLGDLSDPEMLNCFRTGKKFDNLVECISKPNYSRVSAFIKHQTNIKENDADLNTEDNAYLVHIFGKEIKQTIDALFLVQGTEDIEIDRTENFETEGTEDIEIEITGNLEIERTENIKHEVTENLNKTELIVKTPSEFETEDNLISPVSNVKESNAVVYSSENPMKTEIDINADKVANMNTLSSKENESIDLINKDPESGVSDSEMRQFFEELGYAMSLELSLEKQVKLQMQINALVESTLS